MSGLTFWMLTVLLLMACAKLGKRQVQVCGSRQFGKARAGYCLPSTFSYKFFICCSILYTFEVCFVRDVNFVELELHNKPIISFALQPLNPFRDNTPIIVSPLSSLRRPCCRLLVLGTEKSKRVRDGIKIIRGLALLLFFAFASVISGSCFLFIVLLKFQVTFDLNNVDLVLILLQFSIFPFKNNPLNNHGYKKDTGLLAFKVLQGFGYKTSFLLRQLLLLSGDVELNPGPYGKQLKCVEDDPSTSGYASDSTSVEIPSSSCVPANNYQHNAPKTTNEVAVASSTLPQRSLSHPMTERDSAVRKQSLSTCSPILDTCDSFSVDSEDSKELFLLNLKSRMESCLESDKDGWNRESGFLSAVQPETLSRFYFIANQLYRAHGSCDWCLLCGKEKRVDVNSHIFPKSLLKVYREVHCHNEKNCVFDPSTGKRMGAKALTLQLFCKVCEESASANERKLRDLYLTIIGQNEFITLQNGEWLKKILATLMFRGCLTGINFLSEMQNNFPELIKWLLALRMFIRNEEEKEIKVSEKFALYLLPNGPFNHQNLESCYIFDWALRSPSFTTLVRCKGRTFFYTQFDCFHCVLPLDNIENDTLLPSVHNCLILDTFVLVSSEDRKKLFPQLLLEINFWRILEMEMFVLKYSQIHTNCRILTCRFSTRNINSLTMPIIEWPTGQDNESDSVTFTSLSDDDKEHYIKKAITLSPFNSTDIKIKELENKVTAEVESKRDRQSERDTVKNELKECRADKETYRAEMKKYRAENNEFKKEISKLKKELEKKEQELDQRSNLDFTSESPMPFDGSNPSVNMISPPLPQQVSR